MTLRTTVQCSTCGKGFDVLKEAASWYNRGEGTKFFCHVCADVEKRLDEYLTSKAARIKMVDALYRATKKAEPKGGYSYPCEEGDYFQNRHGSSIRVDMVRDGQVFYVSWTSTEEVGHPTRQSIEDFARAIELYDLKIVDRHVHNE